MAGVKTECVPYHRVMEGTIQTFREALTRAQSSEFRVVTAYLDLTPREDGTPGPADTITRQGFAAGIEDDPPKPGDESRALAQDQEQLLEAIVEVRGEGARGLAYLGCAGEGIEHVLAVPLPFRNDVRIGRSGWAFEIERYGYLYQRPITLVVADLHTADIVRVRYGAAEATGQVDYDAHWLTKRRGRTDVQGRGGTPEAGFGGMHSKNRVEQVVEAHRAMFAREAAAKIEGFVHPGDLFFVMGVEEARAQLLNALPDQFRERARLLPAVNGPHDEREISAFALEHAAEAQREEASGIIEQAFSGGLGERFLTRQMPIQQGFREGRVEELILHENAIGHWGTADDARRNEPPFDDAAIEELLEEALRTGAALRFCRDDRLLGEHEGVLATLRW